MNARESTHMVTLKGRGTYNFFLIHNAGGDHRFFMQQVEALRQYGHVTLVGLPGHGHSAALKKTSIKNIAEHFTDLIVHRGLKNLCLVGLNTGANIAVEMANLNRLDVVNLVLIDPPLFMNDGFVSAIRCFCEMFGASEKGEVFDTMVHDLFVHPSDDHIELALDVFRNADVTALNQLFDSLIDWDKHALVHLNKCAVPALVILTDEHNCQHEVLSQQAPHFQLAKVVGSKCWATLDVPEQVNAMIGRFLTL